MQCSLHFIWTLLVLTDAFSDRSLSVFSVSFKGTKNFVMLKCCYFTVPFLKVTENNRPRTQLHPLLSVTGTKYTCNHCTRRGYPLSFIIRIKRKIHRHWLVSGLKCCPSSSPHHVGSLVMNDLCTDSLYPCEYLPGLSLGHWRNTVLSMPQLHSVFRHEKLWKASHELYNGKIIAG